MHTEIPSSTLALFSADRPDTRPTVALRFEGQVIRAPTGITVAAALLMNGAGHFRTSVVSAVPRAAYCMMGVCFECLVEVDGIPSRQACLTTVRDGMAVRRQQGASELTPVTEGKDNEC